LNWWLEYLPPDIGDLKTVQAAIARGPLRID
jgi:hypothetical protein